MYTYMQEKHTSWEKKVPAVCSTFVCISTLVSTSLGMCIGERKKMSLSIEYYYMF